MTLHRLPTKTHRGPPPPIGYCAHCGVEMAWPNVNARWPDACPRGCAPLAVSSVPLTAPHVIVDGTGRIVDVVGPA